MISEFRFRISEWKIASSILCFIFSLVACTDYQAEFDDAFGSLEYGEVNDDSSDSNEILDESSSSEKSSTMVSSSSEKKSTSKETSSSSLTKESSSSVKNTSSESKSSSSEKKSSSSENTSPEVLPSGAVFQKDYPLVWKGITRPHDVVTIGSQIWMAENLDDELASNYCYGGKSSNCNLGERLYTWNTSVGTCPDGWHLPDSTEWEMLLSKVGSSASKKLKSQSWGGSNEYKFSVISVGYGFIISEQDYSYKYDGTETCFWSSTESWDDEGKFANALCFYSTEDSPKWKERLKTNLYSVRCLEGEPVVRSSSSSVKSSSSSVSSSSIYVAESSANIAGFPSYKTVTIGKQLWMAENLGYRTPKGKCLKNDCEIYGCSYTWEEVSKLSQFVPGLDKWMLPTKEDFETLFTYVGEDSKKMLSTEWAGTNESKFNVIQYGYYYLKDDVGYEYVDDDACFWVYNQNYVTTGSSAPVMCFYENGKMKYFMRDKSNLYPVRLIWKENSN